MANGKGKRAVKRTGASAKDLQKVVRYIANLKKWLRKQHAWNIRVRRDLVRVIRKCDPGGPGLPPAPPPPPFKP